MPRRASTCATLLPWAGPWVWPFPRTCFTLYLFYEIVSIFTYPLVAHHQDGKAYDGARKYLTYLMFASKALLLPAMAMVYITCGTLDFNMADIHRGIFPAGANPAIIQACYFMMLFGFAKAAIMPFHGWLPAAMVAPTPVSALLHAVVVVKVGRVFSLPYDAVAVRHRASWHPLILVLRLPG